MASQEFPLIAFILIAYPHSKLVSQGIIQELLGKKGLLYNPQPPYHPVSSSRSTVDRSIGGGVVRSGALDMKNRSNWPRKSRYYQSYWAETLQKPTRALPALVVVVARSKSSPPLGGLLFTP
jgi:hypothetical protein